MLISIGASSIQRRVQKPLCCRVAFEVVDFVHRAHCCILANTQPGSSHPALSRRLACVQRLSLVPGFTATRRTHYHRDRELLTQHNAALELLRIMARSTATYVNPCSGTNGAPTFRHGVVADLRAMANPTLDAEAETILLVRVPLPPNSKCCLMISVAAIEPPHFKRSSWATPKGHGLSSGCLPLWFWGLG